MGFNRESNLIEHLKEQLNFLIKSCDAYDQGDETEGKRIASSLRTLTHQTGSSNSLINQLSGTFGGEFKILSHRMNPKFSENTIFYSAITIQIANGTAKFVPMIDLTHPNMREIGLDDWWNTVYLINSGEKYTRKEIILGIVNKEGGAHVDLSNSRYYKLKEVVSTTHATHTFDINKFELSVARESGFYMILAIQKYLDTYINKTNSPPLNTVAVTHTHTAP